MTLSSIPPSTTQTAPAAKKYTTSENQLEQLVGREWQCITGKLLEVLPSSSLCEDIAKIIARYAFESRLTSWYTALQEIGKLPKKVPELSEADIAFLNSPCPKQICSKRKPNGDLYSIGEKCTLIVLPEELGNLEKLTSVTKSYGEKHYPKDENPLQFCVSSRRLYADHEAHWSTPFGPTHWELHTDLLEGSRKKFFSDQEGLMKSLAQETSKNWRIQELAGAVAAIFFLRIGTGEILYPTIDLAADLNGEHHHSYTRVTEKSRSPHPLAIASTPQGVYTEPDTNYPTEHGGIGVCLKF